MSVVSEFEKEVSAALAGIDGELLVAVSGGADSVAMLCALVATGRKVVVVNCNFGLRGEESDRDSAFVAALCGRLGVELITRRMDTAGYIRRHSVSVEMACRELRYDLFRSVMKERGCARIAVAHNSDDNAETLILNLMRITGIRGLRGMLPDTGEIVRPLLAIPRSRILEYLDAKGEGFVTDSTNLQDDYLRNFVRLRVLPLLETRWPHARRSIAATQRNLRAEAALLDEITDAGDFLSWNRLQESASPETLLHRWTLPLSPSASQIAEMAAHARRPQSGRRWITRCGEVRSERDGLHLVMAEDTAAEEPDYISFVLPASPQLWKYMRSMRVPRAVFLPRPAEEYTLRPAATGDRISPLGMKGSSLVSDIVKDAHLSAAEKERVRVLVDAKGRLIWVDSLKRSRHDLLDLAAPTVYVLTADATLAADLRSRFLPK